MTRFGMWAWDLKTIEWRKAAIANGRTCQQLQLHMHQMARHISAWWPGLHERCDWLVYMSVVLIACGTRQPSGRLAS